MTNFHSVLINDFKLEKPQPQTTRHHKIIHQLEKPCKCETCRKSHELLFNNQHFFLAKLLLKDYMSKWDLTA